MLQVDVTDYQGQTALHHAAWNGCTDAVNLLVAANANIDVRDIEGRTPHFLANECGRPSVIQALETAQNKIRLQRVREKRRKDGDMCLSKELTEGELREKEKEAEERAAKLLEELELEKQQAAKKAGQKESKKSKKKKDGGCVRWHARAYAACTCKAF